VSPTEAHPPGWYPDPSSGGATRWWDGVRWGIYAQPPVPVRQTEGLAIAALITGLLGIPIAPIVLGHMARSRIRDAGGLKDGDGLAIAGLVLGYAYLALIVIVVVAVVAISVSAT
jgi:hypothetical protein